MWQFWLWCYREYVAGPVSVLRPLRLVLLPFSLPRTLLFVGVGVLATPALLVSIAKHPVEAKLIVPRVIQVWARFGVEILTCVSHKLHSLHSLPLPRLFLRFRVREFAIREIARLTVRAPPVHTAEGHVRARLDLSLPCQYRVVEAVLVPEVDTRKSCTGKWKIFYSNV